MTVSFSGPHNPVYFPVEVMYKAEFYYKDGSWNLPSYLVSESHFRAVSNVHANVNLQNTQSSWAEGTLSLLGEQNGMGFISQGLGSDP